MTKYFTFFFTFCCFQFSFAQDDINQLIIANGGQFGNPMEQTNLASFDPIAGTYTVFDTLPVNAVQHIIIEGDYAYVAAQNVIAKYDLDTYERVAMIDFPGTSTHQLAIYEDQLLATNFYGQTNNNLYIFDKGDLSIIDTIHEITSSGGTMVIVNDQLYVGQNEKGNTDACAPFGCYNDTMGYLAQVDLTTNQWVQNISLNNNGNEVGRLVADDSKIYSLNEVSNTITTYVISNSQSMTQPTGVEINTSRYRNEALLIDGKIVALFEDGIGALSVDLDTFIAIINTPVTAFAFDYINDEFYVTATDFFSYNNGYSFEGNGTYQYDFPVGIAPEAIGIHFNNAPVGASLEIDSREVIVIQLSDVASDPDGDGLVGSELQMAPLNGVVTFPAAGVVRYQSLSPGSADAFTLKICDDKLNPLCNYITVDILSVLSSNAALFKDVSVYPNPVADQLYIQNPIEGTFYTIYNVLGKEVYSVDSESIIPVSSLPSGTYFINMVNGSNTKSFQFYKQ
ncbi:MAG: T9SS type A sorting domain-containing protein [Bacteroidetes bacterium]|nr:T9SS type A sorting domain-containing protein [Bacteroidota bacterium]